MLLTPLKTLHNLQEVNLVGLLWRLNTILSLLQLFVSIWICRMDVGILTHHCIQDTYSALNK